jgi:hypothetical protein
MKPLQTEKLKADALTATQHFVNMPFCLSTFFKLFERSLLGGGDGRYGARAIR